ncbi:hypothetical protein VTK73DRAFT_8660 [Phialemonium thermophilum]|uniref:NACHT-NTPase and P-loop NTPases N-terminal domain-containing protein n=1 Tax=Phialemonium thermophilum TaxID=223376 RepID=A0ABR3XNQ2_9PEZI
MMASPHVVKLTQTSRRLADQSPTDSVMRKVFRPTKMQSPEANLIARSLGDVLTPIDKAIEYSEEIEEPTDLPEAFPGVAKHLPIVRAVLLSMRSYLKETKSDQETQETKDGYAELKKLASESILLAERLRKFFDIATSGQDVKSRMESYATEVSGGDRVEQVMAELLEVLRSGAKPPFAADEDVAKLAEALEAVKRLPASLKEQHGRGESYVNSGSGTQAIYRGKGNQNFNTGSGTQFTGNISTFHQGPQSAK